MVGVPRILNQERARGGDVMAGQTVAEVPTRLEDLQPGFRLSGLIATAGVNLGG